MALFTTNENLPIQEQISMLQDQLNMVMGSYQQTKSGLIYYGDGNMPAGSQIQIYEDGSSGAEHLSYDDRQTVLNAGNVQKALEKVAADTSEKKKYANINNADSELALLEEGWVDYPDVTGSRPLGKSGIFHKISLVRQGRIALLNAAFEFNDYTSPSMFETEKAQYDDYGWLFTIVREDLRPDRLVPAFIYRVIAANGYVYGTSKSSVLLDPDGKVKVYHVDETGLGYVEFIAVYITEK